MVRLTLGGVADSFAFGKPGGFPLAQSFHQRKRADPRLICSQLSTMNSQPARGLDATKKIPGEGFKRAWPPLIKMDESVKAKVEKML